MATPFDAPDRPSLESSHPYLSQPPSPARIGSAGRRRLLRMHLPHWRPRLRIAVLAAGLVASGANASAQPASGRPLRALDYLDGTILVDAYVDHQTSRLVPGLKLAHAKVRDILEIPVGGIDASSGGSAPGGFSVQLLTLDDLETSGVFRLVYVGKERLGRDAFGPGQETCLHYDPLPDRRVSLGALIGFGRMKAVADPGPLARLLHVQLDDLDGILLRVPGTMEICGADAIYTLSVVSPEGVCSESADGSATHYRCVQMEGEVLRGAAELVVDPSANPPAACIGGKGGACVTDPYPFRPAKQAPSPEK